MKVRLIKKLDKSRKGTVLICDPWKGRELIKEGEAIEYDGFLSGGQNADDQDDHDAMIAARIAGPTPVLNPIAPVAPIEPIETKKQKKTTDNDKLHK